jgi:DNA invertase Pin-like site-specific DNA recombinase
MRPLATIRKDDEVVILDMDIIGRLNRAQCNLAKMLNKDGIVGWTVWFPEDWLFVQ